MIIDKINQYLSAEKLDINDYVAYQVGQLAQWSFKRQFMENGQASSNISLSQAGKCPRQLAYKYHAFEKAGKEIDSRAKIIFWQGDLVELMMTKLAQLAGCNIMATGQDQLTVSVPFKKDIPLADPEVISIYGHPDGIYLEKETYLIECKSMASFSFSKFEKGEVDESYLTQMNLYMHALNLNKCIMIAMNKDNGVMGEKVIDKSQDIILAGLKNIKTVLNSTPEKLPEGWYTFNEKTKFYPWQCLYCAYWKTCKPNAEQVVVKNAYKLKEKST